MKPSLPRTPHEHAELLASRVKELKHINEADTRHQIIDGIIHNVLCWPVASVMCESHINPGYSDYILLGRREKQVLFLEAKKAGIYFSSPSSLGSKENYHIVKTKTLLTDKAISKAISQVRTYCVDMGCEYGAITNGNQWIFFRTFIRGQDWRGLNAIVITSIAFFVDDFATASTWFSYRAITENASLMNLFEDSRQYNRPRYFPKEKVTSYDHEVTLNHLAPVMRPLVERYFRKLSAHDGDFMDKCYVNNREYLTSASNVKQLIHDTLSPYFRNFKVKDFLDERDGGAFGNRVSTSARELLTRDVIVLFGGKGSGKSTFIHKLLYHKPPHPIKHFTQIAIIDMINCPEQQTRIEEELWSQLIRELDTERILFSDREALIILFGDRYDLALKQALAGLSPSSEAYNLRLNALIEEWKNDKPYCAKQLAQHWRAKRKGAIVVLDNTDQFSLLNQDYCFTLANYVATELNCLVVISMREERFHHSKLHGTLDAFHNSGFHLSSPDPAKLFNLRLTYLIDLLNSPGQLRTIAPEMSDKEIASFKILAVIFLKEFKSANSHLKKFIKACAHGNMRLALDFFRQFVLSGYLQIDEMIATPTWTLQIHQVIRPMMVPYRLFFDEGKSSVPNIYQIRSEEVGSHFTGLRLLRMLSHNRSDVNYDYVSISKIRAYFAETFNMLDDAEKTLDVFLQGGVVESNTRVDEYSDSIDSIKITAFGAYIKDDLAQNFAYLDLVCLDCGIHDLLVSDSLAVYGNQDRNFFLEHKKRDRLNSRIDKVRCFLEYLQREEELERDLYALEEIEEKIMPMILKGYKSDEYRVLRSAQRNI